MRTEKVLLLVLAALVVGGLALPVDALARGGGGGGGGGGHGGHGGHGGGRGKYKGKDGKDIDRPTLIETAETDMHNGDRDARFQSARKSDFEAVLKAKREEVLARHRHMGEDSRRQEDSRLEVSR
jgi:hypothetical protein